MWGPWISPLFVGFQQSFEVLGDHIELEIHEVADAFAWEVGFCEGVRDYPHLEFVWCWSDHGEGNSVEDYWAFVDEILGLKNFEFEDGGVTLGCDVDDLGETIYVSLNHVPT